MQRRLVCGAFKKTKTSQLFTLRSKSTFAEQAENENSAFTNTSMYRKPFRTKEKDAILNPSKATKVNYKPQRKSLPSNHPANTVGKVASGMPNTTPMLSEEETINRLTQKITSVRGGFDADDGTASAADSSWGEYFEWLERADPQVSELYRHKPNLNNSAWFFDQAPPSAKPMQYFERRLQDWRNGKMMDKESFLETFRQNFSTLPLFKRRIAADPFRDKPHLAQRVSYKNLDTLFNFVSAGGNILGRKHTGVTGKTQRKVAKELQKARFLGLIPYTANPEFTSSKYQPLNRESADSNLTSESAMFNTKREVIPLQSYIENLQKGISPLGTIEWDPTKEELNPHASNRSIMKEKLGLLPEQMEEKKKGLKKMILENIALQKYGQDLTKERIRQLSTALQGKVESK